MEYSAYSHNNKDRTGSQNPTIGADDRRKAMFKYVK